MAASTSAFKARNFGLCPSAGARDEKAMRHSGNLVVEPQGTVCTGKKAGKNETTPVPWGL